MNQQSHLWELTIIDAQPERAKDLCSLAIGDIDGDGCQEMVTGGDGALLWYRPLTSERGLIAAGNFGVGLCLADLDKDGIPEILVAEEKPGRQWDWTLAWYKPENRALDRWEHYVIDADCNGQAHDIVFEDLDGDGERELVTNAAYCGRPGLFAYKQGKDIRKPWRKHTIECPRFAEGTAVADLDGDGKPEIVYGPYVYFQPAGGPFAGPWKCSAYAPSFREMCRTAVVDVNRDGRPDILTVESEYLEGRFSWFENKLGQNAEDPWTEHELERGLVYAHSLDTWRESGGGLCVFLAEMAEGGWSAPRNWNARCLLFTTDSGAKRWDRETLTQGPGTHQAVMQDIDGDGQREIIGKQYQNPQVQVWHQRQHPSPLDQVRHRLLDRGKRYTATDILAADIDGDGKLDIVCGSWWYRNPNWERHTVPGVYQVVNAYDIDGDGRQELIATKPRPGAEVGYESLSSDFCWLKLVDAKQDRWEEHPIGVGSGSWPHGTVVAPILPGGRPALVASYHGGTPGPEIFEIPSDLTQSWPRRTLANIPYGEEIVACDLLGRRRLDLVAGPYWLENLGDGQFEPHRLRDDGDHIARVRVADINGDGKQEIIFVEERLDFETRKAGYGIVGWLSQPADPRTGSWDVHVIDRIRSPHSLDVADLDGDGQLEVVCAEHDPFWPYRTRSRLIIYKRADSLGRAWTYHMLDDRFEHHDGAEVFEFAQGRLGIISHGWTDSNYVHLWELSSGAFSQP